MPIKESNKQIRVRSKATTSYKCYFSGCINNNLDSVKFHRIPPPPPPIPKDAKLSKIFTNKFRRLKRNEILDSCGLSRNDDRVSLRICEGHRWSQKKVNLHVDYQNKEYTKGYSLTIPSPQGKESSLKRGFSF